MRRTAREHHDRAKELLKRADELQPGNSQRAPRLKMAFCRLVLAEMARQIGERALPSNAREAQAEVTEALLKRLSPSDGEQCQNESSPQMAPSRLESNQSSSSTTV